MTKQTKHISAVALFVAMVALSRPSTVSALDASMSIGQQQSQVAVGGSISIPVVIDAGGHSVDTARVVLTYNPNQLHALGFRLTSALDMAAPTSYIDNGVGLLSWGGFHVSERISGRSTFGVATFKALAAGPSEVTLTPDSHLISGGHDVATVLPHTSRVVISGVSTGGKISEDIDLANATRDLSPEYNYRIVHTTVFCSQFGNICDRPWWTALVSLITLILVLFAGHWLHHYIHKTNETTS